MNTAPTSTPATVAVLNYQPSWIKTALRALAFAGAIITAILGLLSQVEQFGELLPVKYAMITGIVTVVLMGLKEGIIAIGDIWDNGVRDNSFKLGLLLALLLPCGLVSCGSVQTMTDRQLAWAKAGVQAAEIAFAVAEMQLAVTLADPDMPAWQRVAAVKAMDVAAKQLADAKARYQREQDRRAAELLPPGAKTVLDVVPSK